MVAFKGNKIGGDYYNKTFIQVLDSYYAGDYTTCIEVSANLISKDSSLFDAYVFYCRSLIYKEHSYVCPSGINKQSPINEICERIYKILTYKDVKDSIYGLYQMNKNLYSFQIAALMDHFIKTELNEPVNDRMKYFHISHFDPLFTRIWMDDDESLNYIDKYKSEIKDSLACLVWRKRILNELVDQIDLPKHISEPINIDYYFYKKLYKEAYSHCDTLYRSATNSVPIRQIAVSRMIECLFRENKVQTAINR